MDEKAIGAILVVGGGIGGIQASLDLANSGYKVYLLEEKPAIGGKMAKLDKTFPTNDCAMCIMSPKLVDCGRHPNIELLTYSQLEGIKGDVGNFKVKVRKKARFVDESLCTGCGECVKNCLVKYKIYRPEKEPIFIEDVLKQKIDEMMKQYGREKSTLISILQDINEKFNYLPEVNLKYIAESLGVPLSQVYQIASFFKAFSLKPRGKHIISVCLGTACHIKGGMALKEKLERDLKIKVGETTPDMMFTLETVRCLGCCGLAPVITIDEDLYGEVTPEKLPKILDRYRIKEATNA